MRYYFTTAPLEMVSTRNGASTVWEDILVYCQLTAQRGIRNTRKAFCRATTARKRNSGISLAMGRTRQVVRATIAA